jgi:hypothetical protein
MRSFRPRSGTSQAGARAVVDAGADGLSLVNTIRGLALDPVTLRPRLARAVGGTRATRSGRSPSPASTRARTRSTCPSSHGGSVHWGSTRSSSCRRGERRRARDELFSDPLAPARVRESSGPRLPPGDSRTRPMRGRSPLSIRKKACKSLRTVLLDSRPQLARLVRSMVRRRRTPRHRPAHSTSGWKPSNVRTTFGSGVPS